MRDGIDLPEPCGNGAMTLEAAIGGRRSWRDYAAAPLTLAELSQLLWSASGPTSAAGQRAAPSAGARYPLHLYVVAGAVAAVPVGLYAYDAGRHGLVRASNHDLRPVLDAAAIGAQPWVRNAAAIIVVMADMPSITAHFADQPPPGERGARYAWIETGALTENIHLQATGLGLGAVLVGGFDDAQVRAALPEGALQPTALLCLGRRKPHP